MAIIGETTSEYMPTVEIHPEVIAMRWRNGVLEQGRKELHIGLYGIAIRQGIHWEPVPTVPDDLA